jgi:hypothetical protein
MNMIQRASSPCQDPSAGGDGGPASLSRPDHFGVRTLPVYMNCPSNIYQFDPFRLIPPHL